MPEKNDKKPAAKARKSTKSAQAAATESPKERREMTRTELEGLREKLRRRFHTSR